jgi:hypothetical protein
MIDNFEIGRIFTPLTWASWLVEVTGAFQLWLDGASVLDPTCGDGAFLEAFIYLARSRGIQITEESLSRLHGVEIFEADKQNALARIRQRYDVCLVADNFKNDDFLKLGLSKAFDVIVGNPPWMNFTDLPIELKRRWGSEYITHGLIRDKREVLLGRSRSDIACLVIKKALDGFLNDGGLAAFFIPLSLFFNSGSNDRFRPYPGSTHTFRVTKLWDFGDEIVFSGVGTRYGAVLFHKGSPQVWPVETDVREKTAWIRRYSTASDNRNGAWHQHDTAANAEIGPTPIEIRPSQKPRQGVNTCGANDLLIFEHVGHKFMNGLGSEWELEETLLFPLMNANNFRKRPGTKQRWILLPHDHNTGRPLSWEVIAKYPKTIAYLSTYQNQLASRKGVLINAHINRGFWWSLLGVGPYSFAPWKVAWESLGRREFTPTIINGRWQGNQALHAFCPCASEQEATSLASALSDGSMERWLKRSGMEGTCNWAQPGRMAYLFNIREEQGNLFAVS